MRGSEWTGLCSSVIMRNSYTELGDCAMITSPTVTVSGVACASGSPMAPPQVSRPLLPLRGSRLPGGKREQAGDESLGSKVGGPAVGGGDSVVEPGVGGGQPGGARVVEFRQGALGEALCAVGIAGDGTRVAGRAAFEEPAPRTAGSGGEFENLLPRPLGRVQPAGAEIV